ncbi:MAG: glycosyltransferase [Nitrospinota bacterium]
MVTRNIAFVSSFLPRKCGIATFTSDLIENVKRSAGHRLSPLVVAMEGNQKFDNDIVKFEIRRNVKNDYISAADYINFSGISLVSIQHEYGLFGGNCGSYISLLLNRLNKPIITTLHTILDEPAEYQYKILCDIADASYKIVVMSHRGITMLKEIYNVPEEKIEFVPHGMPDLPFVDSNDFKHELGFEGRKIILTFGLLNRDKGIEVMIKALPRIVREDPAILYVVLGITHPEIKKQDGEGYRLSLQRLVKDLDLKANVIFHNRFVNDIELHKFLCAADFYVTPYLAKQRLTSGTLAFALGAGKAIVSTPYWYAEELLADGRGRIVPFGDHEAITHTMIELLQDPASCYAMRKRAYDYCRNMTWLRVGAKYWNLFSDSRLPLHVQVVTPVPDEEGKISVGELPELQLDHLERLTDSTGIFQHTRFIVPDRYHGYCTDDNARSLEAMVRYYHQSQDKEALKLLNIYLSFIYHAQRGDGSFNNFMSFDRKFLVPQGPDDAFGRSIRGLGITVAYPPNPSYLPFVKNCFERAVPYIPSQSLRGKSYSIIGLADYLKQFPGASDIKRYMVLAADSLMDAYERNATAEWKWFEKIITYDNGALPQALFVAYRILGDQKYLDAAKESCHFLLSIIYDGDHFSFIGNDGWHTQSKPKPMFDQQPIDVASTVFMLRAAYEATEDTEYLTLMRKAFDWFLGENDLHIPVYNFTTGGCGDGLTSIGINPNQGGESTLCFLLALLCITEIYSARKKHRKSSSSEEAAT